MKEKEERDRVQTVLRNARNLSLNVEVDEQFEQESRQLVKWVVNSQFCARCLKPFVYVSLNPFAVRAQHHCRLCGNCVCFECSPFSVPVGRDRVLRACKQCFLLVESLQNENNFSAKRQHSVGQWQAFVVLFQQLQCEKQRLLNEANQHLLQQLKYMDGAEKFSDIDNDNDDNDNDDDSSLESPRLLPIDYNSNDEKKDDDNNNNIENELKLKEREKHCERILNDIQSMKNLLNQVLQSIPNNNNNNNSNNEIKLKNSIQRNLQ